MVLWLIWAAAVAALFAGPAQVHPKRVPLLAPLRPGDPVFPPGSFADGAVYPETTPRALDLPNRGSWLQSDAFVGEYRTSWLRATPRFAIQLAGYPALPPNRLEVELRRSDGSASAQVYDGPNPGERWQAWTVDVPPGTEAVRIHAVDGSAQARGWLAFGAPFAFRGFSPRDLWPLLQLGAVAALALTLLAGPGLVWLTARPRPPGDWALASLLGPLLLAALGGGIWILGGWIPPSTLARCGVAAELAGLAWCLPRRRRPTAGLGGGRAVAAAAALLALFAAAKANLSSGPQGELFGGMICRTLAVGDRSDSRISYHVVQTIAHHFAPLSPDAERLFAPWTFASRGPLSGLVAAPLVLAVGAEAPAGLPIQAWRPFDPQGFAAYRLALIVLASLSAWAVFGLAAELTGVRGGRLAAALTLLSPFFVHEMYFTWPKLAAAGGVLCAFLLLQRRRPFPAGLALAVADLYHPGALLSAPFLALWILGRSKEGRRPALAACAWFVLGAALLVGPWMEWGRQAGGGQFGFFDYFRIADSQNPTWDTWWASRWSNLANTFVPFYLTWAHSDHPAINPYGGGLADWKVHWDFLVWNTLPFALGLPAFLALAAAVAAGARRTRAAAWILVLGPAAFAVAYWGPADTGLMRECGHVLFFAFILFGLWTLEQPGRPWRARLLAALAAPAFFLYRALDLAWTTFGTSLDHGGFGSPNGYYGWNDALSLALAAAFLAAAVVLLAWSVRTEASPGLVT